MSEKQALNPLNKSEKSHQRQKLFEINLNIRDPDESEIRGSTAGLADGTENQPPHKLNDESRSEIGRNCFRPNFVSTPLDCSKEISRQRSFGPLVASTPLDCSKGISRQRSFGPLVASTPTKPNMTDSLECLEIRDVDADDHDKANYCCEFVNHVQSYNFSIEHQFLVPLDYLENRPISPKHRAILMNRMVALHHFFNVEASDVLHLLINIIDRFLFLKPKLEKNDLHLVGVTAFFIASKFEDKPFLVEQLAEITDYECSGDQIKAMEMEILKTLEFRLDVPHALLFLRRLNKVSGASAKVYLFAKYIIELAHVAMTVVNVRPSKVAAAALYLSLKIVNRGPDPSWDLTMQHYSRYRIEDLVELAAQMYDLVIEAPSSSLRATYSKYCNRKFYQVALIPYREALIARKFNKL